MWWEGDVGEWQLLRDTIGIAVLVGLEGGEGELRFNLWSVGIGPVSSKSIILSKCLEISIGSAVGQLIRLG